MNDREKEIHADVFNPEESDLEYMLRRGRELNLPKEYPCRECGKMGLGIPDAICPICGGK